MIFERGDNNGSRDLADQKTSHIEVPDIRLENPMFCNHIAEKAEPCANWRRIFPIGFPIIIGTQPTRSEL